MGNQSSRKFWAVPALALAACAASAALVGWKAPRQRPPRTEAHSHAACAAAAEPGRGDLPTAWSAGAESRRMAPPRHAPARPPGEAPAAEVAARPIRPPGGRPDSSPDTDDAQEPRRDAGNPRRYTGPRLANAPPGRSLEPVSAPDSPRAGATRPEDDGAGKAHAETRAGVVERGWDRREAGVRATLSGRVLEADSTIGIAGAAVEVTPQGGGSERRRVIASGDGSYLLANLAEGTCTVQASHLGYAPLTVVLVIGREGVSRDLVLAPFGGGTGSGVLSGRITDAATRAPIRTARLTARAPGFPSRTGLTDGDGRYRIANLPAVDARLLVTATGYRAEEMVVTLSAGETRRDLTLVPESSLVAMLTGEVLSRVDGAPLSARLLLRPAAGGTALQSASDAEGAFRFDRLAPGDWALEVEAEGFLKTSRPVHLAAGQRHEQVLLEAESGMLYGVVISTEGDAPISGARVSVDGEEAWTASTDEKGRFRIDVVQTGRRRFRAEAEGFGGVSFTLQVLGGAQEVVVELDPLRAVADGE